MNLDLLPPEDLDQILLDLSYEDLLSVCSVNIHLRDFCRDDTFWRRKILYKIGDETGKSVTSLKPKSMTYREQYKDLVMVQTLLEMSADFQLLILDDDAVDDDPLTDDMEDLLITMKKRPYVIEFLVSRPDLLDIAARILVAVRGLCANFIVGSDIGRSPHLHTLIKAMDIYKPDNADLFMMCAISRNNCELLSNLMRNNLVQITEDYIEQIMFRGHYTLLTCILEYDDVLPHLITFHQSGGTMLNQDLIKAINSRNIDNTSLKLLIESGIIRPVIIDQKVMNAAKFKHRYDKEFIRLLNSNKRLV